MHAHRSVGCVPLQVTTRIVELRQQEIAASLAHKAAKHALKEASEAVVELTARAALLSRVLRRCARRRVICC
jgi:hypothetical protein